MLPIARVASGDMMGDAALAHQRRTIAERTVERTLFGCRWLLALFYLGLAVGLVVLLV